MEPKICAMCGLPTISQYPMCQRPGACGTEYRRLWARDQDKAHRNEVTRRYRHGQKTTPFVYAILFPAPEVLKIGFSTSSSAALYVGIARQGARSRGWGTEGSSCIWKQPGDVRTEAWIQATASFMWPGAFSKYQNRVPEWFYVAGMQPDAVVATLTEIYQQVPRDRIKGGTA